ncbi:MAG: hypothetical protein LBG27_12940 [Spirochaetaceae bacterium]|jgi:hypothetical protein|nr:hypothetical protein [Spirochaetaceae bacterium]
MKSIQKKAALLVIFAMTAVSFVNAQEAEGIGLTAGVEAGSFDLGEESKFGVIPNVVYENSFGALDVFAKIDYKAVFSDPSMQELYIEEKIGYNLGVIEGGTLSIILNNNNTIRIKPELEEGETYEGTFEPAVQWTQTLGFGDLGAKFGLPVGYLTGVKDADAAVDFYFTLGWESTFGLGVEFGPDFSIKPESDMAGWHAKLAYDYQGFAYGEVELETDKEFKGVTITPELGVNLNALNIYVKAEIEIVPEDEDAGVEGDTLFSPFVGVKYTF